uniref:(California timema) hypothetical protein n=1 Tax=Timema californicum TaxID=61474 RepID=A0A7R9JAM9_TIMCA|nr:unnamed protein product [Timema californicum]
MTSLEELTPEEKWRLEHIKIHEQHKGHDAMHLEMILHSTSHTNCCSSCFSGMEKEILSFLSGVGFVPVVHAGWHVDHSGAHVPQEPMVEIHFLVADVLVYHRPHRQEGPAETPGWNNPQWFYLLYKLSYALGLVGYVVMMAAFFGLNLLFDSKVHIWMDFGMLFLFYGLYYGVLGRDVAEICADKMASHVGYYTAQGMPTRSLDATVCAVCGNKLLVQEGEEGVLENTYKLSCEHVSRVLYSRLVHCGQEADLPVLQGEGGFKEDVFWERPHVLYGQLLDWIRWLVAWQPLILCLVQGINWALGLE